MCTTVREPVTTMEFFVDFDVPGGVQTPPTRLAAPAKAAEQAGATNRYPGLLAKTAATRITLWRWNRRRLQRAIVAELPASCSQACRRGCG
jgi:hypothetical protein